MNLFNLKERKSSVKRILLYPNITYQKDLKKDSYIQVITQQIKLLNEIRDDLWFYSISPEAIPSLAFSNVTQLKMKLPTYPQTMRTHFNVFAIQNIISHSYDFDLIMCHLPEHASWLKNVMYNVTHFRPPFMGYCHWFDLDGVVAGPKDTFLQNIFGLLEYHICYLNTQHQKDMVLTQAGEYFNDKQLSRLDDILTVQHLGVDVNDIIGESKEYEKIIVFNHRPDTYKHFNKFMSLMDKLAKIRNDFKVWIPLLEKPNRDYVFTTKAEKKGYYKLLQNCAVGFSPKQKYGGWSVATTDGLMNGVPYIMYHDTYYNELWDEADFFKTDKQALNLLNIYLSDPSYREEMSYKARKHLFQNLIYKNEMIDMNDSMNNLIEDTHTVKETDTFKRLVQFIKNHKTVEKSEIMHYLGWGRGIPWTPYRRGLSKHPNIVEELSETPRYFYENSPTI